ncbi:hypothetical protein I9W82_003405 [Candida metapsilosis]|uniref:DDE-1 domain-containing protein n=1 Tax=Candida metapsilosis TaxID=273372 RepID=A0A8H8DAY8_9ASCO|nr:hypothetical protein I9W82_003405 [Candida metapsilosis]
MSTSKQLKAIPGDPRERLAKKFRLDEDELSICGEEGNKILAESSTFTVGEEYGICCYLAKRARSGFIINREVVLKIGQELILHLDKPKEKCNVGKTWADLFLQKYPQLLELNKYIKSGDCVCTPYYEEIQDWFESFQETRATHGVKPERVYCVDMVAFVHAEERDKWRHWPNEYTINFENDFCTLIETISMTGERLNPSMVFKGDEIPLRSFPEKVPDWGFVSTKDGSINDNLAFSWLQKVFIPGVGAGKDKEPVILLHNLDEFRDIEFLEICRENNIIYIPYATNSEDITNPFTQFSFSLPNMDFDAKLFNRLNDSSTGDKMRAKLILALAESDIFSKENILDAWHEVGIQPYNPKEVLDSEEVKHDPLLQMSQKPAWIQNDEIVTKLESKPDSGGVNHERSNIDFKKRYCQLEELRFRSDRQMDQFRSMIKLEILANGQPWKWGSEKYISEKLALLYGIPY